MRGSASVIIRRVVFIFLLFSAGRSMSATIKCLLKEGALEDIGECLFLSARSLTLIGIPQTQLVGSLGETLRVPEETGTMHLHLIPYWDDRPPARHRTSFGITNVLDRLMRMFILPTGPRNPKKPRRH